MPFEDLSLETQDLLRQKAICVQPLGYQTSDRFKIDDQQHSIPPVREWRLNLARLSHIFNLFFIALKDQIYVYQPSYPDQRLPIQPSLIISPPVSPQAHTGTIDPSCPHSINHLLLDFIGDLEVVIVACDDGDVLGFYTHEIQSAIDRRTLPEGPAFVQASSKEVRPFFHVNVGLSAWGLSVNSNARKLAISSNAHTVTVITFDTIKKQMMLEETKINRHDNYNIKIAGFNHNLPSVAFCNTDDDPDGRIVITGELTGFIYMHDLAHLQHFKLMQAGFCRKAESASNTFSTHCSCADRHRYPHAIWTLAFIDRRAFRHVAGYAPAEDSDTSYRKFWNGSILRLCIPDSSSTYKLRESQRSRRAHPHDETSSNESGGDDGDTMYDDDDDEEEDDDDDATNYWSDATASSNAIPARDRIPSSLQSMTHPWSANTQPPSRSMSGVTQNSSKKFHVALHKTRPQLDEDNSSQIAKLRCPLLITSKNDLLLQQPELGPDDSITPVIAFEDPLKQAFDLGDSEQQPSFTFPDTNRISFQIVIVELGALIVGSPSGRIGIFSLLRTDDWPLRPEGTYFMRLDWFLPFKSQEEAGERPERKLVGLTAGPMQGQTGRSKKELRRRWRLMCYYAGHDVLSFELSLPDG